MQETFSACSPSCAVLTYSQFMGLSRISAAGRHGRAAGKLPKCRCCDQSDDRAAPGGSRRRPEQSHGVDGRRRAAGARCVSHCCVGSLRATTLLPRCHFFSAGNSEGRCCLSVSSLPLCQMKQLGEELPAVKLALSLHAPNQELRVRTQTTTGPPDATVSLLSTRARPALTAARPPPPHHRSASSPRPRRTRSTSSWPGWTPTPRRRGPTRLWSTCCWRG